MLERKENDSTKVEKNSCDIVLGHVIIIGCEIGAACYGGLVVLLSVFFSLGAEVYL